MKAFPLIAVSVVLAAAVPAFAQQPSPTTASVEVRKNQIIVDADGRVLGKVHDVDATSGIVTFAAQMRLYKLPLTSLSAEGKRLKTSLKRAQVGL